MNNQMLKRVIVTVFTVCMALAALSAQAATNCSLVTEIPTTECQSLVDLYTNTTGPGWTTQGDWNVTNSPCSWLGVTCVSGHVAAIDLNTNNLNGNLPNLNLGFLTSLKLYNNQLSGPIPDFTTPNLVYLYLDNNQLSGPIPNFTYLYVLTTLSLSHNTLTGSIPNFSSLYSLRYLGLCNNQLSGSIPGFANSPALQTIELCNNNLSGAIPTFTLPALYALTLAYNQLSGTVPALNWASYSLLQLNHNCGLIPTDAVQAGVLINRDPNWQELNLICPPTITGISPASGPTGGGTNVAITGTKFLADKTTVTFDGTPAINVSINSLTSLTCTTPAHASGPVDVVVKVTSLSATSANGFTYTPVSYVWKANAASSDWKTGTNWVGDSAPPDNTTASVNIPQCTDSTGSICPVINSDVNIGGITIGTDSTTPASLKVNSGFILTLGGNSTNNGTLNLQGGNVSLNSNTVFTNNGTLIFEFASGESKFTDAGSPGASFINNGTIRKNLVGDGFFGISTFNQNSGSRIEVTDGNLKLAGGTYNISSSSFFTGTGRLVFGDAVNYISPHFYFDGSMTFNVPFLWEGGVIEPKYGITAPLTLTLNKKAEIIGVVFKKALLNITVSPGYTLAMDNSEFYLGNSAKLLISSGAELLIKSGISKVMNYDAASTDELINIGGSMKINSAGSDALRVVGKVVLGANSTLQVVTIPTPTPADGQVFDVLYYPSSLAPGSFGSVSSPPISNFHWEIEYANELSVDEKTVRLTLKQNATPSTYTLSVSVNPSGAGSVSVHSSGQTSGGSTCTSTCSYSFSAGTQVSLYATPYSGHQFSSWSGASGSSSYPQEAVVTMDGNKSVTANFVSDSSYPYDPYYPPDYCPNDPNKIEPGICGCGVADIDSDSDGIYDCKDLCPKDPKKIEPGVCGCGTPDTDSDEDGVKDCKDLCPKDPKKTAPGICGCGIADTDRDSDGTADCKDLCPDDPKKTEPGKCGCGIPDTEYCGKCPPGSLKTEPGICGCDVPDTDSDKDGTPDCIDKCPDDPNKTEPGKCGCGKPETENCGDSCPDDPNKTEPGKCGCGIPDTDSDKDGTPDCKDKCPKDPKKTEPGICGCGVSDADSDGDGIIDCRDGCPKDPKKTASGICGCGISDEDSDGDGVTDCVITEPPQAPTLLSPKFLEVVSGFPLLKAGPFVSGGSQYHLETHWLIQRADHLYRPDIDDLFDHITVNSGTTADMTSYLFNDAAPGLKYSFKAGYKGSGSNRIAWSQVSSFIAGTLQVIIPAEITPGDKIGDYQMISFPYWTQAEKLEDLLKNLIGEYDRKMFRIGTYDPMKGGYVEYGEGVAIEPGRAFWFLSRNGMKITFDGVPVSLNHAIDIKPDQGWNMIAPPNNADYDWTKIEVLVFDDTGKIVYSGLTTDQASQEYVDSTLWLWVGSEGDYVPTTLLEKGKGCWIRVKKANVVLRFSENARMKSTVVRKIREQSVRFAESVFTPKQAVATSDEKPPMPMGNSGFSIESDRVDGGGGCFIDTAAKDVF